MKQRVMIIGDSKNKADSVMLWNKEHTEGILLKYSYPELEKLLTKEIEKE